MVTDGENVAGGMTWHEDEDSLEKWEFGPDGAMMGMKCNNCEAPIGWLNAWYKDDDGEWHETEEGEAVWVPFFENQSKASNMPWILCADCAP